jgi:hypothetical protein
MLRSGGTSARGYVFQLSNNCSNRTKVFLEIDSPIIGVGDDIDKKESINLAALSALYQLQALKLVCCLIHCIWIQFKSSKHTSLTTPDVQSCLSPKLLPKSPYRMVPSSITKKHAALWIIIVAVLGSKDLKSTSLPSQAALSGKPS